MTRIQYRDTKESKAQIDAFAHKVLRRLHGLGARTQTLDDVQQELWIAWCKACEQYDPTCGASFKTFLYRGMQLHINRYVEKNFERFHDETIALSLEGSPAENEDDAMLGDVVPDERELQNEELEREDMFAYAASRMSPRARQFMTFLKEQPKELLEELRNIEKKGDYAKSSGLSFAVPRRITTAMVFDLMGASRSERHKILEEVAQLGRLIAKQVSV